MKIADKSIEFYPDSYAVYTIKNIKFVFFFRTKMLVLKFLNVYTFSGNSKTSQKIKRVIEI